MSRLINLQREMLQPIEILRNEFWVVVYAGAERSGDKDDECFAFGHGLLLLANNT